MIVDQVKILKASAELPKAKGLINAPIQMHGTARARNFKEERIRGWEMRSATAWQDTLKIAQRATMPIRNACG